MSEAGRAMLIGQRVGAYQVVEAIGAGGMGEVFRARDVRLGRDVAIKVIPTEFTSHPDRLARFEREARALAALNHPNIATVYGIEDAAGSPAIVMELVAGDTLAERLARRKTGLPVKEALDIARQLADALDAAHEKGIVHRDLKPANIKITPDGVVKVLDFGLAKLDVQLGGQGESESPTVTIAATGTGVIVGTAAYMSPEQARGLAVDKRTDIWAFGSVLYEMLTGRAAFSRATLTDTLAAIVQGTPDWTLLPTAAPAAVHRILRRCLEKEPKRRLRDIGDVSAELDGDDGTPQTRATSSRRGAKTFAWLSATALVAALAVAGWTLTRPDTGSAPGSRPVMRTIFSLPANQGLSTADSDYPLALSPDGARIAYVARQGGETELYVRELAALTPRPIPGTAGARHPFFSPDGKWIGFFAGGALQKVAAVGGVPLRIATVPGVSMGASWGPDDTIVWASRGIDLSKISASGGVPQVIRGTAPADWPDILPDGKTVLFTNEEGGIATIPLEGGSKRIVAQTTDSPLQGPPVLGGGGDLAQARFVASGGYLVYGVSQNPGAIRAVRFDAASLTAFGSPVTLVDSIERAADGGAVYFAVSSTGLLVYAATGDRHQLVWVDRHGSATPISADRAAFRTPRLSPDGTRIAVGINDETRRSDIWIYDAERGTRRRLTTEKHNLSPLWTPDGRRVTFSDGGIAELSPDATGARDTLLSAEQRRAHLPAGTFPYPRSWSPDGRDLLFQSDIQELWVLPRGNATPHVLLRGPFNVNSGQFSPDGQWLAYTSDESGRSEIYVAHYPDFANRTAVSANGGVSSKWSRDGREIFYREGDALMAVSLETKVPLRVQKPQLLFTGHFTGAGRDPSFDVSPDGQRFVMVESDEASALSELVIVQNWFAELTGRD